MMMKYTDQHEWIRIEGDTGTIGITEYAAHQLGDVVFTELPSLGKVMAQGSEAAVVESVKAASEIYAPVSGEVIEINKALEGQPDLINTDPVGAGWFFKIKISNFAELDKLMEESAYEAFIGTSH
ncbi:MAG: glycine cleavage system protein GcvH [Alphaproteobacteria bacterium]|nr:glycine cleavage system protein GcvH [Alphaproteobacteria bacterium]